MIVFGLVLFSVGVLTVGAAGSLDWTNSGFPDIRGPTHAQCNVNISAGHILYLCDPDEMLSATDRKLLIETVVVNVKAN